MMIWKISYCSFYDKICCWIVRCKYAWEDNPYQYAIDYQLDTKLASKNFKDTFISMIVNKTFETNGIVEDVPTVMKETDKYRHGEDFF